MLAHIHTCGVKASGGCKLCRRMWLLMQYHAKTCLDQHCRVPRCNQFKEAYAAKKQQSLPAKMRHKKVCRILEWS
jgi:hypothetical protein